MIKTLRGSALIEFSLALPIVISLVIPAIQLLRAALLQTRLEVLAFRVARRLAVEPTPESDLSAAAEHMTAGFRPAVVSHASVRTLTTVTVAFPRRPRRVEIVEVDLAADGPEFVAGVPFPLRAHAREFRWSAL
jgi:hypothetical protein